MIREIQVGEVKSAVRDLIEDASYHLPDDYLQALADSQQNERSSLGQSIILTLRDNAAYAEKERIPTCQDTGMAILSLDIGQDIHFSGGDINGALEDAVREAYQTLRKSVIADPLQRTNTADNTPPVVYHRIVPGDRLEINIMLKGFGAELMSRLEMFPPSVGLEGVKRFVVETVEKAGPNACPPVIVGVGLGSTFEGVALLAKNALMRPLNQPNSQPHLAQLEQDLLVEINKLGIGPQGFGGSVTALGVNVESYPTHIAAIPVAVNLNCSAPRRARIVI